MAREMFDWNGMDLYESVFIPASKYRQTDNGRGYFYERGGYSLANNVNRRYPNKKFVCRKAVQVSNPDTKMTPNCLKNATPGFRIVRVA